MTIEEQLQQVQEELAKEREERTKLEANQKEQNRYIGSLESQLKNNKPAPAPVASPQKELTVDPVMTKYLLRKMKEETYSDAMKLIADVYPKDIIECVKPDLERFLNDTMTAEKTSVSYIVDGFDLMYGRARRNKEHAVNKLNAQAATPAPTAANPFDRAKLQQQAPIQQNLQTPPPAMTARDINASQTPPADNSKPANSKDAINRWKEKMLNGGQ